MIHAFARRHGLPAPAVLVRCGGLELAIIEVQKFDPAWLAQVVASTKGCSHARFESS